MDKSAIDDNKLKEAFKAAITAVLIEILEERRDLLRDALAEVLEEVGLVYAIQEGEQTPAVSREEVFKSLETGS